jgi:hypothetical protein
MEAIHRLLVKFDAGDNTCSGPEFRDAIRVLDDLGWKRNMDRPEPAPPFITHKTTIYPWWFDPQTGEQIRGSKNVMRAAYRRFIEDLASGGTRLPRRPHARLA